MPPNVIDEAGSRPTMRKLLGTVEPSARASPVSKRTNSRLTVALVFLNLIQQIVDGGLLDMTPAATSPLRAGGFLWAGVRVVKASLEI